MSASDRFQPGRRPRPHTQAGFVAVEFGLLAIAFFMFVFGIIEVSRTLYLYTTLQEVTRRAAVAAVHVYPEDGGAIARVRQQAVFRSTPGELWFGAPVTDAHIRISYLRFNLNEIPAGSWPDTAAAHRQVCMANPHADNCIRFVQVQACASQTGACRPVNSQTLFSFVGLRIPLHMATTIAPAETLGWVPGTSP